jgi:hypothetical protein
MTADLRVPKSFNSHLDDLEVKESRLQELGLLADSYKTVVSIVYLKSNGS